MRFPSIYIGEVIAYLLSALKEIQKDVDAGDTRNAGICGWLEDIVPFYLDTSDENDVVSIYIDSIFMKWPEFSGFINFPVPCACESPMDSFYGHKLAQSLWSGEYGRARKRLLAFMIDCVQDDLSNPWW